MQTTLTMFLLLLLLNGFSCFEAKAATKSIPLHSRRAGVSGGDMRKVSARVEEEERYTFVDKPLNWFAAREYCESMDKQLASIKSSDDLGTYISIFKANDFNFVTWVGGYNLADWETYVWVSWPPENFNYTNWGEGQPFNQEDLAQCVQVDPTDDFHWKGAKCEEQHQFVCEKAKYL